MDGYNINKSFPYNHPCHPGHQVPRSTNSLIITCWHCMHSPGSNLNQVKYHPNKIGSP